MGTTRTNHDGEVCQALDEGYGGWVQLGFMVDPKGKPFEITIIRSTGNKTFDKVAMESIERSVFEPASVNGQPIESGYELKYVFVNNGIGVHHEFQGAYKSLTTAIQSGDRTGADAAMARLKVTNLSGRLSWRGDLSVRGKVG